MIALLVLAEWRASRKRLPLGEIVPDFVPHELTVERYTKAPPDPDRVIPPESGDHGIKGGVRFCPVFQPDIFPLSFSAIELR
jgi:hypothetical protein